MLYYIKKKTANILYTSWIALKRKVKEFLINQNKRIHQHPLSAQLS